MATLNAKSIFSRARSLPTGEGAVGRRRPLPTHHPTRRLLRLGSRVRSRHLVDPNCQYFFVILGPAVYISKLQYKIYKNVCFVNLIAQEQKKTYPGPACLNGSEPTR